jgi:hypothetical protein
MEEVESWMRVHLELRRAKKDLRKITPREKRSQLASIASTTFGFEQRYEKTNASNSY